MKNLLKLTSLIKHTWPRLFGIMLFSLLAAGFGVLRPYIFKLVIDQITALSNQVIAYDQFKTSIIGLTLVFLIASLVFTVIDAFGFKLSDLTINFVSNQLLRKIYSKLSSLSIDFFENKRFGETVEKINRGINSYMNWINMVAMQMLDPIIFMAVVLMIFLYKIPVIGIIFIIFIFCYTLVMIYASKKSRPIQIKESKSYEKAAGIFTESFSNITTLRSIGSLKKFQKQHDRALTQNQRYFRQNVNVFFWSIMGRDAMTQIFVASVIVILAINSYNKHVSAGDLVFYLFLIQSVLGRIQVIGRFIDQSNQANIRTGRLIELFDTKPTLPDEPAAEELLRLYSIEFIDVSFAYPNTTKGAIKNISFKLDTDKTIALVGPSGVGKSTITKLMLRFYAPTSGQILVNGEDISTFTAESLRSHIGTVMQDVVLFNTTIKENISIAYEKASTAHITKAAQQAHAKEFIEELPKKYKTLVGERGIKLSGGQKQRIAIARAILKNPQLIILDEATSALDSVSERLVQNGLKKLMTGRSALIIAHRLSTVMHADEIIVLKGGLVTERGNHRTLIRNNGLYAKLFRMQSASGRVKL